MKKLLLALAILTTSLVSHAWTPEKNINFVIPYSAGGGYDFVVRMLIPPMEEYFRSKGSNINIIPRNVEGAGGRKAASLLQKTGIPDGYEIMIMNVPGHGDAYVKGEEDELYTLSDFTYISTLSREGYMVLAKKGGPINTIEDLRNKSEVLIPTQGAGNTATLVNEAIWDKLGVNVKYITGYKGSSKVALAVLQGEGDVFTSGAASARKYESTGDYKIILDFNDSPVEGAVNGPQLGFETFNDFLNMRAVVGPPNMPVEVATEINEAIKYALKHPDVLKVKGKIGDSLAPSDTPEEARKTVFKVFDTWRNSTVK